MNYPKTLPQEHQQLLVKIISKLSRDIRIVGIGASGSYASDSMDKFSDLDLVVAINPDDFESVMEERFEITDKIEGKVASFTGEHVGEPRLIIALYSPDAIHVDFKFVSLPDAAVRVDNTQVLWERDELLSKVLASSEHRYPQPDPQWIEDRFWIWVHYGATKIARGEYFEALEFLSFLRTTVLSPLALKQQGFTPTGVRKIEICLPVFAERLKETVGLPAKKDLITAFEKSISLYLDLRKHEQLKVNPEAQNLCIEYFELELKS
jgi:predicted nucleotidyltransferase